MRGPATPLNTEYLDWHPQCPGPMRRGTNGDERIDPWALACPEAWPRSSLLVERSPLQGVDTHRCMRQRHAEMRLLRLGVPAEQRSHVSKQSSRGTSGSNGQDLFEVSSAPIRCAVWKHLAGRRLPGVYRAALVSSQRRWTIHPATASRIHAAAAIADWPGVTGCRRKPRTVGQR